MTRVLCIATLLTLTVAVPAAYAGDEVRSCEYDVKARCTSGAAAVTLTDGSLSKLEVTVFYCGLRGRPGYTCMIDSSRSEKDESWSDEGGATVIASGTPLNPTAPDRVKVTVGKYVSIDFSEAQSGGRCGAGAEPPEGDRHPGDQRRVPGVSRQGVMVRQASNSRRRLSWHGRMRRRVDDASANRDGETSCQHHQTATN
jgi:hypothetical protein